MRLNRLRFFHLPHLAAILVALVCQFFCPGPALAAGNLSRSTVRLSDCRGASPLDGSSMAWKSVLRLVVKRELVSKCVALETLECGHQTYEFQPWAWEDGHLVYYPFSAKRRRCHPCQEAIDAALVNTVKKPVQSEKAFDWRKSA
jgi:hypothetical protein